MAGRGTRSPIQSRILTTSPFRRQPTVADAMLTRPAVHPASLTVGELRVFFSDPHVHMALLVDGDELLGTVGRDDLTAAELQDRDPGRELAAIEGRTVEPDAELGDALERMRRTGRRRLVVVSPESKVLGLLCLKASGNGFCSDEAVAARRQDLRTR